MLDPLYISQALETMPAILTACAGGEGGDIAGAGISKGPRKVASASVEKTADWTQLLLQEGAVSVG